MGHETIMGVIEDKFPRRLLAPHITEVVPQFKGLVRTFTPRRSVFNFRSVHFAFMTDNSALRKAFS